MEINQNDICLFLWHLTLEQPIFGVNTIKWNRRIEPVRYAEAKSRIFLLQPKR